MNAARIALAIHFCGSKPLGTPISAFYERLSTWGGGWLADPPHWPNERLEYYMRATGHGLPCHPDLASEFPNGWEFCKDYAGLHHIRAQVRDWALCWEDTISQAQYVDYPRLPISDDHNVCVASLVGVSEEKFSPHLRVAPSVKGF